MTDLFTQSVTIYISVASTPVKPRTFERRIIENCQVQGGFTEKSEGTIRNIVNAKTLITKNVANFVSPLVFEGMPIDLRQDKYTAQIGDFVVLAVVDDVVETAEEFAKLQQKYKDNGIKVTMVNAAINGMAVDNITITNA